jgi:TIR domain
MGDQGRRHIYGWMEKQFDAASHVLCVVSDEYLKAPYSSWERGAAQWASVTGKPNFVLPVFVEPCKAPKLFAPLKRCDLHGITEDEARTRLKAFLDPAKKPPKGPFPGGTRFGPRQPLQVPPPSFPGTRVALSNIPIRVPLHFFGRGDALAEIGEALKRHAVTVVHGLRGAGKTTLAAAYAEKHRGDYRATWWIRRRKPTPPCAPISSRSACDSIG